jgi:hypothetical protein
MENSKLLHKQIIRFTIDVEVSVVDYPQALIDQTEKDDKYLTRANENPEDFMSWMEFQKRLLYAVVNNTDLLSEMMQEKAGLEAADYFVARYMSSRGKKPLEEILEPVINSLNAEDKKTITSAIDNGVLAENTEAALDEAFRATTVNNTIDILQ